MRLILDPAEEAVHAAWLQETPGAYEWWYFDARSADGVWTLACIWFLGNPFSSYYAEAARGQGGDPLAAPTLFFALYKEGRLHAYHFSQFEGNGIGAGADIGGPLPTCLRFGPNTLALSNGQWQMTLTDENANGRHLEAALSFIAPPLIQADAKGDGFDMGHSWLPAAPFCTVSGEITLREAHNPGAETSQFIGTGYHDHNWGRLPFDAAIQDWYWARAALGGTRAAVLYHVRPKRRQSALTHLLLFDGGRLRRHETGCQVTLLRPTLSGLGAVYATRLTASAGDLHAEFTLEKRLDSAPFYVRALCRATVREGANEEQGQGIGEYLSPGMMGWPLVASAMKARIVRR